MKIVNIGKYTVMLRMRFGEANAPSIFVNTCETQAKKSSHTLIELYTIF
ncbi:hypothetical protein STZ1_21064 [Bacillus subtilis]